MKVAIWFLLPLVVGLCIGCTVMWFKNPKQEDYDKGLPILSELEKNDDLILPSELFQKYSWNWGNIDEKISLSPASRKLLTPSQSSSLVTAINGFLSKARQYERSMATFHTDDEGYITVQVGTSPATQNPINLENLDFELKKIFGANSNAYWMIESGIKKELTKMFPFLTEHGKKIKYILGNTVLFEEQVDGSSFPSKRNYVPATQKHLLKVPLLKN